MPRKKAVQTPQKGCKNARTNAVQTEPVKRTLAGFWYACVHMKRLLFAAIAFALLIPTANAGTYLGEWKVTRYYTPVPGQARYYNGWSQNEGVCKTSNLYYAPFGGKRTGSYTAEACMNGQGDIFTTADGTNLSDAEPYTVAACPRSYLGRTLHIANIGYVRCADTGGAIHGARVDVWAGIGDEGYTNIATGLRGGTLSVHLKDI